MKESMWYLSLWDWLISPNMLITNSIHFWTSGISFFIMAIYIHHTFSIHSSINWILIWFHNLAIMKIAVVNWLFVCTQRCYWATQEFYFEFLQNLPGEFHCVLPNSSSHNQYMNSPLHILTSLFWYLFFRWLISW
jgi:hypothetical protein